MQGIGKRERRKRGLEIGSWCRDPRPHEASPSGDTQMWGDSGKVILNVSCQEHVTSSRGCLGRGLGLRWGNPLPRHTAAICSKSKRPSVKVKRSKGRGRM